MRTVSFSIVLLLLTGCSVEQGNDLECPTPQTGNVAGTISESRAQITATGDQLALGGATQIAEVVNALRARHPDASNGAIVNYMVTAYCPTLNRRSSSDRIEKKAKLTAFSTRVEGYLFGPSKVR